MMDEVNDNADMSFFNTIAGLQAFSLLDVPLASIAAGRMHV